MHELVCQFLEKHTNPATRQAYRLDLERFEQLTNMPISSLWHISKPEAVVVLQNFCQALSDRHEKPRTISRRVATVKSLVRFAYMQGCCAWLPTGLLHKIAPIAQPASALSADDCNTLLQVPNPETLIGKRDYALLCLLLEGRFGRSSLCGLNVGDVPKLEGLSQRTREAIADWLSHRDDLVDHAPLFIALDRHHWGHRLTGQAIYLLLNQMAKQAGLTQTISFRSFRRTQPNDLSLSQPDSVVCQSALTPTALANPHADLLTALLADRRSPNTKRAYAKDLRYFFHAMYHQPPHPQLVEQFLALDRFQAIALVLQYKAQMIQQGLKEATVNRRLSALKSLVQFANKLGHCQWSLQEIQGEPVQAYRDTTGIAPAGIKAMLAVPDRQTRSGKRDYAILRLLWDNALRRQEVVGANVADFDPQRRTLAIRGKGKGSQQTLISLSLPTNEAIAQWLAELQVLDLSAPANPLFIALDPAHLGHRLTGTAIYQLVQTAAQSAGITKIMSPHRIRHSAITAALDATNGNVRKVQKLSRHKRLDTLMIYDDNRANLQGEVSSLLSELI